MHLNNIFITFCFILSKQTEFGNDHVICLCYFQYFQLHQQPHPQPKHHLQPQPQLPPKRLGILVSMNTNYKTK